MTVTDVRKDPATRTLTLTATFEAPVERVWQVWADPRQLERWWGPPEYPATVVEHDLRPGGRVIYYMTGPEGDRHYGWWLVRAVDAPNSLEFEDGFGDETGAPDPGAPPPTFGHVTLAATADDTTRMVITSTFASVEAMEQLVAMGMVKGITASVGQIDGVLASAPERASG